MPSTLTPGGPPPAEHGTSTRDAAGSPPLTDQGRFDAAVRHDGKIWLQVAGGVAIVAALVMSTIALFLSADNSNMGGATMMSPAVAAAPTGSSPAGSPMIKLSVAGANKMGPDGKLHDSFSKTDFAVKVGQPTRLRIDNADDVPHSITSAATGVSITVRPGVHTYTLVATKPGHFEWVCVIPCDSDANGWAMTHPGYMAGYITAT
jgi:uncharacterized cupredoxin-like copper-binding protein